MKSAAAAAAIAIKPVIDQVDADLHGPFHPEDVREGELVRATIKSRENYLPFEREMRVWRISPLGIELLVKNTDEVLPKGLAIDLSLIVGKQVLDFRGLVVDYISEKMNRNFLCVRLTHDQPARALSVERRSSSRWQCGPQYFPTCVAANPAKYNDFLYFSIKDLSPDGAQLQTSLRNKFILQGMVFDAIVSFPMIGQAQIQFKVKNVRVLSDKGAEYLSVGCEMLDLDKKVKSIIAQYILQFSNINSLSELKFEKDFNLAISKALTFSYVKTEEEYKQVLDLRHRAYLAAGKIQSITRPQDMADQFDGRSRIVIGKYNGKVIASCRLAFASYEEQMEQEQYVNWPQDLPRRDECVEMMRLCTDPEFRGSDVITAMFQFMALTIVQSKRRWVVICATEDMLSFYQKVGFTLTRLSYPHKKLNNKIHYILYSDVAQGMVGRGMGPIFWNIVWKGVSDYMRDYKLIIPDPLAHLRIFVFRLFGPLAKLIVSKYKTPRRMAKT